MKKLWILIEDYKEKPKDLVNKKPSDLIKTEEKNQKLLFV